MRVFVFDYKHYICDIRFIRIIIKCRKFELLQNYTPQQTYYEDKKSNIIYTIHFLVYFMQ